MNKPKEHTYKVKYEVEFGNFSRKEIVESGKGGCDAIGLVSFIYPEDGSLSLAYTGKDGRTKKELADTEWFKAWSMMAHSLSKKDDLEEWQRAICLRAIDSVRAVILSERRATDNG